MKQNAPHGCGLKNFTDSERETVILNSNQELKRVKELIERSPKFLRENKNAGVQLLKRFVVKTDQEIARLF